MLNKGNEHVPTNKGNFEVTLMKNVALTSWNVALVDLQKLETLKCIELN